ncbi:MAG: UDP-N-acetylglucosamine 4,6-dehydratase (inverting) [Rhodospirillaceae bacterium]|nr:UDP-N-acetylglucosamine 4,6-dehydratase (inverting) [Rhodospirillaceae bacterium]
MDKVRGMLANTSIMVTGGTGSFGNAFIRLLLRVAKPRRVIIFSRDELKQFEMQNHPDLKDHDELRYFIGDVRDQARLETAMRDVDYVVHAAALKQVMAAEYNPFECIRTNVHGAENVVRASINVGIKAVVALSTDKAVNPINLYGASKLASDKIFVAGNYVTGKQTTKFSVVRYGNVAGSRGSVLPFFRTLIANGAKKLPITDARMTRFWITLEEGCDFVLTSLGAMEGGEVFVPKIPSLRMVDLATAMAPQLPHDIVGIRPGEKLHEALISDNDGRNTLDRGNYFIIEPDFARVLRPRDYQAGGKRVADDFAYTSDKNSEWLDVASTTRLLKSGVF